MFGGRRRKSEELPARRLGSDNVDDCVPKGLQGEDEGGSVIEAEVCGGWVYASVDSVGTAGDLCSC